MREVRNNLKHGKCMKIEVTCRVVWHLRSTQWFETTDCMMHTSYFITFLRLFLPSCHMILSINCYINVSNDRNLIIGLVRWKKALKDYCERKTIWTRAWVIPARQITRSDDTRNWQHVDTQKHVTSTRDYAYSKGRHARTKLVDDNA